jgi:hypothetical protein
MFTATKGKALLTTTTGALPRPSWYTANLRGMPLSHGLSQAAYREQHFDFSPATSPPSIAPASTFSSTAMRDSTTTSPAAVG